MYFVHYNAGKRGITLDLKQPDGRARFEKLLASASIVFDNGGLAKAGFHLSELIERQPPLVIVSVTTFGVDGPRSVWQGSDLIVQAMSGMIGLFGNRNERPARYGPFQAEEMGGLAAALGALVAWYGSHESGRGDFVDIAMHRVCALSTFQMANASLYHQFGFARFRSERTPGLPAGLYAAKDGYFAFNAWRDIPGLIALFDKFGAAPGLHELFATEGADAVQRSALGRNAVTKFVASRSRAELTDLVQNDGLMGLPVHDVQDLLGDPFLGERAFFADIEIPGFPTLLRDTGAPVRLSGTPFVAGRRPPLLGEHNAEIFAELGLPLEGSTPPPRGTE